MNIVLSADHIGYPDRLSDFSFSLKAGEVCHFIGRNGSGKSTALSLLSGLLTSSNGSIFLLNRSIEDYDLIDLARHRSYLLQQDRPPFSMTVVQYWQLIVSSLPWLEKKYWMKRLQRLSTVFSLDDKWQKSVEQLSGGEWQRVRLVASCLQVDQSNHNEKIWLLDEPAAALDVAQEGILHQWVRKMANKGVAVVMVNHELNRTLHYADRVVMFDDGLCVCDGIPTDVMTNERLSAVFQTPIQRFEANGRHGLWFTESQI
jgi:vitamin B12 transport system ATP-binding protein